MESRITTEAWGKFLDGDQNEQTKIELRQSRDRQYKEEENIKTEITSN